VDLSAGFFEGILPPSPVGNAPDCIPRGAHRVETTRQFPPYAERDPAGLALACDRCNGYKRPNLTSVDPDTGAVVPLFHPRNDAWDDHFMARDGYVFGVTPVGRATVRLLNMNALRRVELRRAIGSTSG
jgi:hypothetical protein